jgi:hypothetical protein
MEKERIREREIRRETEKVRKTKDNDRKSAERKFWKKDTERKRERREKGEGKGKGKKKYTH